MAHECSAMASVHKTLGALVLATTLCQGAKAQVASPNHLSGILGTINPQSVTVYNNLGQSTTVPLAGFTKLRVYVATTQEMLALGAAVSVIGTFDYHAMTIEARRIFLHYGNADTARRAWQGNSWSAEGTARYRNVTLSGVIVSLNPLQIATGGRQAELNANEYGDHIEYLTQLSNRQVSVRHGQQSSFETEYVLDMGTNTSLVGDKARVLVKTQRANNVALVVHIDRTIPLTRAELEQLGSKKKRRTSLVQKRQ